MTSFAWQAASNLAINLPHTHQVLGNELSHKRPPIRSRKMLFNGSSLNLKLNNLAFALNQQPVALKSKRPPVS